MEYPRMVRVRQRFAGAAIGDVEGAARAAVRGSRLRERVRAGGSIAVGVGSRGVAHIADLARGVISELRELGYRPFIVPAMGSHGGATAEGQAAVLAHYGVSEATMGVPVRSSMEVEAIGRLANGQPVYWDRHALSADGVVLINRVKPHTDFHGRLESGVTKMAVIGLGKHEGARSIHRFGTYGLRELIPQAARIVLDRTPLALGIATVENGYDQPCIVRAVEPEEWFETEMALLEQARSLMARLPVDQLDLLIVERMGKDISGCGMDTNVIGRMYIRGEPEPERPDINRILVLDLTPASDGNAAGIGLADFTVRRLVDKIDFEAMNANVLTSNFPQRGFLPLVFPTDRAAVDYALSINGWRGPREALVARIRSTLELAELQVSEPVARQLAGREDVEILDGAAPLDFDASGALI